MSKKIIIELIIVLVVGCVLGLILINNSKSNQNNSPNITEENNQNINDEESEKLMNESMRVIIDNKEYEVSLNNNKTVSDILEHLPMDLTMKRYAGHEYYSELNFTPPFDSSIKTSHIKEAGVYYWDGWNSFVINFEDYDISPYEVVPIGTIHDKEIVEILKKADNSIDIKVIGD